MKSIGWTTCHIKRNEGKLILIALTTLFATDINAQKPSREISPDSLLQMFEETRRFVSFPITPK